MTDGPFKNAKLSSHWKRFGKDLVSDATSPEERTAQACNSMLKDEDMKVFGPLLRALKAYVQQPQMDLDMVSSIEAIFENHQRSPLMDTLQKHMSVNLRDQLLPESALDQALASTVRSWINTTKNRLDEECIRARDIGDMSPRDYSKGIERNRQAFAAIIPDALCHALTSGNQRAFRRALQKKSGIDEGPDE